MLVVGVVAVAEEIAVPEAGPLEAASSVEPADTVDAELSLAEATEELEAGLDELTVSAESLAAGVADADDSAPVLVTLVLVVELEDTATGALTLLSAEPLSTTELSMVKVAFSLLADALEATLVDEEFVTEEVTGACDE